jgi:hypothetical protein
MGGFHGIRAEGGLSRSGALTAAFFGTLVARVAVNLAVPLANHTCRKFGRTNETDIECHSNINMRDAEIVRQRCKWGR